MAFESFDIKRVRDNQVIPQKEIDLFLRKELSLKDHEIDKPFGHFYFPESREELDGFQESISWAGLIHTIAYYSKIHYGKCSTYDVESAMAWTREYVLFPHSAYVFVENLMKVLEKAGLYVFIHFHDDKTEDEYKNSNGGMVLKSESGLFECSYKGELLNFYPASENLIPENPIREHYVLGRRCYTPCVHNLIIPEGVTSIKDGFFARGHVESTITFPSTLTSIGDVFNKGVFSGVEVNEMVIPPTILSIGNFAFENSRIQTLRITFRNTCEHIYEFRNLHIDRLIISRDINARFIDCFIGDKLYG